MKMNRIFSIFLSLLIISSSGCLSGEVDDFYGEDISPPISVDDFVLVDENGDTVSMSDFHGSTVTVRMWTTTESRMDSIVAPIHQKVRRSITTGVERRPSSRRETW